MTLLPQPDSPTSATISPGPTSNEIAVDDPRLLAARQREVDPELPHGEKRRGAREELVHPR